MKRAQGFNYVYNATSKQQVCYNINYVTKFIGNVIQYIIGIDRCRNAEKF